MADNMDEFGHPPNFNVPRSRRGSNATTVTSRPPSQGNSNISVNTRHDPGAGYDFPDDRASQGTALASRLRRQFNMQDEVHESNGFKETPPPKTAAQRRDEEIQRMMNAIRGNTVKGRIGRGNNLKLHQGLFKQPHELLQAQFNNAQYYHDLAFMRGISHESLNTQTHSIRYG